MIEMTTTTKMNTLMEHVPSGDKNKYKNEQQHVSSGIAAKVTTIAHVLRLALSTPLDTTGSDNIIMPNAIFL